MVQSAAGDRLIQRIINGKVDVVRAPDRFLIVHSPKAMRLQFVHKALASGGAYQKQAGAGEPIHHDCP